LSRAISIHNQKNFAAGLLYIVIGGGFAIGATVYKLGTAARMGPGYFPFWLGLLLALIGAFVLVASLRTTGPREKLPAFDWRSLTWILASVALFGFLLPRMGLVISLVALVLVASRASHEFSWKGAIANAAVLLALCLGAFIYALKLQLPLWPAFIG